MAAPDPNDVALARVIARRGHLEGFDAYAQQRAEALGLVVPGFARRENMRAAADWLVARFGELTSEPAPVASRAVQQLDAPGLAGPDDAGHARYQTLVDRLERKLAHCNRCRSEARRACSVLHVHRTVQADGAELRVAFPVAVCDECMGDA